MPTILSNGGGSALPSLSSAEAECIQEYGNALSGNSITASCIASSSPVSLTYGPLSLHVANMLAIIN